MLTYEKAKKIYDRMISQRASDEDDEELFRDMLTAAFNYAAIRAKWNLYDRETKMNEDAFRSANHDSFMNALKVYSRYQGIAGKDNSWVEELGDPARERKTWGDFACFLAYHYSLEAR